MQEGASDRLSLNSRVAKTINDHAYKNYYFFILYLCVFKRECVWVCVLLQFILIRFVDVKEMSNEALDCAILSDKWWWKYLFLPHRLRCWHRYLFFYILCFCKWCQSSSFISLISSASTKCYTFYMTKNR